MPESELALPTRRQFLAAVGGSVAAAALAAASLLTAERVRDAFRSRETAGFIAPVRMPPPGSTSPK